MSKQNEFTPTAEALEAAANYFAANLIGAVKEHEGETSQPAVQRHISSVTAAMRGALKPAPLVKLAHDVAELLGVPAGVLGVTELSSQANGAQGILQDIPGVIGADVLKALAESVLADLPTLEEFGELPLRKGGGTGKSSKGNSWSVDTVSAQDNGALGDALARVARFSARTGVNFNVQHGSITVKQGVKTLGMLDSELAPVLGADGTAVSTAAAARDEAKRFKVLFYARQWTKKLSKAQRDSVHAYYAGCVLSAMTADQPDTVAAAAHVKAHPAPAELKAFMEAESGAALPEDMAALFPALPASK